MSLVESGRETMLCLAVERWIHIQGAGGTLNCWGVQGSLGRVMGVWGEPYVYTAQLFMPGGERVSCHIIQQNIFFSLKNRRFHKKCQQNNNPFQR